MEFLSKDESKCVILQNTFFFFFLVLLTWFRRAKRMTKRLKKGVISGRVLGSLSKTNSILDSFRNFWCTRIPKTFIKCKKESKWAKGVTLKIKENAYVERENMPFYICNRSSKCNRKHEKQKIMDSKYCNAALHHI